MLGVENLLFFQGFWGPKAYLLFVWCYYLPLPAVMRNVAEEKPWKPDLRIKRWKRTNEMNPSCIHMGVSLNGDTRKTPQNDNF